MPISVLLQQILIIFLEIGIGAVAAKCNVISSEGSKVLSNLVMYITLPCTLLASTNISGGADTVLLMLLGFALLLAFYLVCIGICLALSRSLHLPKGKKAVLIGTGVMPNSAFIGIPLCTALLGNA